MRMKSILVSTALFALAGPALAQTPQMPPQNSGTTQPQRAGEFERLDTNNDGVITREEVRAARTTAFTRLDTNRDGFLDRAELAAGRPSGMRGGPQAGDQMARPKGERKEGRRAGDMLARADANNDGNVTRAEFDLALATARSEKAARSGAQAQAMFDRLDTNRDGTITRAEADAARAQMAQRNPRDPEGMGPQGQGRRGPMGNLDTNNDGKITLAEWLARPDPLFDRGDANNDGRVTREEAAAAMRAMRGGGRGEGRGPGRPW